MAFAAADCHLIGIALRRMNALITVAGRTVQDGVIMPGSVQATPPAVPIRGVFRGPYDVLHLHVPNTIIVECAQQTQGNRAAELCCLDNPVRDPMVEQLGRALLAAERSDTPPGMLYMDSIGIAIIALLLGTGRGTSVSGQPRIAGLSKWRLKRAIDYVEAHLAEPMTLAEIAASAGLSRMHFAAQFRAATGLRPHEFVLRRRIERAQEMLLGTQTPLVQVALSVGFQTQSHFTSVFKQFVGQPPLAWRQPRVEQRRVA